MMTTAFNHHGRTLRRHDMPVYNGIRAASVFVSIMLSTGTYLILLFHLDSPMLPTMHRGAYRNNYNALHSLVI